VTIHSDHKFSITIETPELAAVYCLRALSDFSQKVGNRRIVWGGTKDSDWVTAGNRVTFRFSDPIFRDDFTAVAYRLLPPSVWTEVARSDTDPATPQP
jgi:hypothetical protein